MEGNQGNTYIQRAIDAFKSNEAKLKMQGFYTKIYTRSDGSVVELPIGVYMPFVMDCNVACCLAGGITRLYLQDGREPVHYNLPWPVLNAWNTACKAVGVDPQDESEFYELCHVYDCPLKDVTIEQVEQKAIALGLI